MKKRKILNLMLATAMVVGLILIATIVRAQAENASTIDISACGTLDTSGGSYVLSADVVATGTCFEVAADNIELDCNGHTIDGIFEGRGVSVEGVSNVTVKNCNIKDFARGIFVDSSNNSLIENNISSMMVNGIHMNGSGHRIIGNTFIDDAGDSPIMVFSCSNGCEITGNEIFNNPEHGIHVVHFNDGVISDNYVHDNGSAITVVLSTNVTISSNTLYGSIWDAIWLDRSSFINVVSNNVDSNGYVGIRIFESNDCALLNNIVTNNVIGINLESSNDNTITNNDVFDNTGNGIELKGSSINNDISYNNIYSNVDDNLVNEQSENIIAENNWWGSVYCDDIDARIRDDDEDPSYGTVDFNPVLDAVFPGGVSACCLPDTDGDGIPDYEDACPEENATGYDADQDGCLDTSNGLIELIESMPNDAVAEELKNSLISKVENAEISIGMGNENAAILQLNAFIQEIEAQSGNKISIEAAELLLAYAQNLIDQIMGS